MGLQGLFRRFFKEASLPCASYDDAQNQGIFSLSPSRMLSESMSLPCVAETYCIIPESEPVPSIKKEVA